MPDIQMTQSVKYWNLHTEALIDEAAGEIYHDDTLGSLRTDVTRSIGLDGRPDIRLTVYVPNALAADAALGTTLVKSAAGWEVLTDEQATARGIPVPAPAVA